MENTFEDITETPIESQLVYIKPFSQGDTHGFAIHGADGKPMGVFDSYDSAFFTARMHDLAPVSLH